MYAGDAFVTQAVDRDNRPPGSFLRRRRAPGSTTQSSYDRDRRQSCECVMASAVAHKTTFSVCLSDGICCRNACISCVVMAAQQQHAQRQASDGTGRKVVPHGQFFIFVAVNMCND